MFLSKIEVSAVEPRSQAALSNPYLMHQALLRAFPPELSGGGKRVLYRIEPGSDAGLVTVLVQSDLSPEWNAPAVQESLVPVSWNSKEIAPSLAPAKRYRFRLRGNPTVRRDGKRLPLVGDKAQREWLERKLEHHGCKLLGGYVVDEGKVTARRPNKGPLMTFLTVRYDGVLEVANPELAREALSSGIGPAKAFGCGLLSLAPA